MSNVYYSPGDFGLRIFASIERPDMDYEFDIFVVWVNEKGDLFYATDAGCSCPEPFEDVRSVEELSTVIGADGLRAFFETLTAWREWNEGVNTDYVCRKVREYMTR